MRSQFGFLFLSSFLSSIASDHPSFNYRQIRQLSNTTKPQTGLLSSGAVDLKGWEAAYSKATSFVANLTNAEKITIIGGGSVPGKWTALKIADGTQGLQGYDYVTGWSESSALAMTWDKDFMYDQLKATALEFYGKGIQLTNAPTSQPLGRSPWGGRLVEAFGPDSYHNGIAFGIATGAFKDAGIVASGKHFLLNEQETNRNGLLIPSRLAPYDSWVGDKALHETYLWPFYDGVKGGMGSVMCAMTKVNGTLSCENEKLLMELLKTELGFPGMVTPDIGSQATTFGSANGGLDWGSAYLWSNAAITAGLKSGNITQERLNDMVVRNVIGYYNAHQDNGTQPPYVEVADYVDVRANHSKIVRRNGAASIVLLKNERNALPLKKPRGLALFGIGAGPAMAGPNYKFGLFGTPPTYDGHLAGGAGSGQTSFPYLVTPHQALVDRAAKDGSMIRWILNNSYVSDSTGFSFGGSAGGTMLTQSIPAYTTDTSACLVFINAFSGEGADRTELRNSEQDNLILTVAKTCNNTVVIVNTVGTRILDTWIEHPNVTAVLYAGLLGQESGNSILDVLYGDVNPSGRLTYTIAKTETDYNVGICQTAECYFLEGNFIDYKHFDNASIEPRFEFGFGLSYTDFEYSSLQIHSRNMTQLVKRNESSVQVLTTSRYPTGRLAVGGYEDLWDTILTVTVDIQNVGLAAGNEIAQLYISYPESALQPVKLLRGFEKTYFKPGEKETVSFALRRRDLSHWDVEAQKWAVETGKYTVAVGASSRDLRATEVFNLQT